MIRFKKDETVVAPVAAAPVPSEATKTAVEAGKPSRQKGQKTKADEPKSAESLELFRPAVEQDAE